MEKFFRSPTKATGGLTEKEKKAMEVISKKWIGIAYQTGKLDENKIIPAIKNLYKAANLAEPRVIIVPSPLVMAYAYGLSAGWWYKRGGAATSAATFAAKASDRQLQEFLPEEVA